MALEACSSQIIFLCSAGFSLSIIKARDLAPGLYFLLFLLLLFLIFLPTLRKCGGGHDEHTTELGVEELDSGFCVDGTADCTICLEGQVAQY